MTPPAPETTAPDALPANITTTLPVRIAETSATATPPAESKPKTQEATPKPPEMTRAGFGGTSTEAFKPRETKIKDKNGKDTNETLYDAFKSNLTILATQLEQYSTSQGAVLSPEQSDFLALYKRVGSRILDTEDGWMLANLVMEQDMMLRLAAIGQDLENMVTKRLQDKFHILTPNPNDPLRLEVRDVRGIIAKYGLEFMEKVLPFGPFYWTWEGIRALFKKDASALILRDFQMDISRLPKAYRKYINHIAPHINERDTQRFILQTGLARVNFYEALGAKPTDLEAATPWQRLRVRLAGGVRAAPALELGQENLNTEWVRVRRQALEELAKSRDMTKPEVVRQVFFAAQEKTIRHFLNHGITEIAGSRLGVPRTEEETIAGMETPDTVATLEQRKAALQSQEGKEKLKAKKTQEQEALRTELTAEKGKITQWEDQVRTKKDQIESKNLEFAKANAQATGLPQREQETEQKIFDLHTDLARRQTDLRDARTQFAAQLQNADKDSSVKILEQQTKTVQAFESSIATLRDLIEDHETRLASIRERIVEPQIITNEVAVIQGQINDLESQIGRKASQGARKKVAQLEEKISKLQAEIDAGIEPAVKAEVAKIDAATSALGDYGRIVSEPVSEAVEKMLTVTELISDRPRNEYGNYYPEGYLRILDHVFQHNKAGGNRQEVFVAARTILRPRELAQILNQSLHLRLPEDQARNLPDVFKAIQRNYRRGRLDQTHFGPAFMAILQHVQDKANHLGEV